MTVKASTPVSLSSVKCVSDRYETDYCSTSEVDRAVAEAKCPDGTGGRGGYGHIATALRQEHEQGGKAI